MTFLHPHHHHHSCSHNGADRLREQEARCPKPENSRQRAGVLVWFRLGSSRSRRSRGCSADEESPAASLPSTVPPLLPASTSHSAAPVSSPPASLPSLPANVIHCLCSSGDLLRQGKTANIYRSVRRGWWRAGVGLGGGGVELCYYCTLTAALVNHCGCDRKDAGQRRKSQPGKAARPCAKGFSG